MEPGVFLAVIIGMIMLVFLVGVPFKPMKWIGKFAIRLIIGAVVLFLVNTVGNQFGLHIPINAPTTLAAGLLGIPGVAALVVIQTWIIG